MKKLILGLSLLLSSSVMGDVEYEVDVDPFTDKERHFAFLYTYNSSGNLNGAFTVRCVDNELEVYFTTKWGLINEEKIIVIRIDKQTPIPYFYTLSTNNKSAFFEHKRELLSRFKKGDKAVMKFHDWSGDVNIVYFSLQGSNDAITKVENACDRSG